MQAFELASVACGDECNNVFVELVPIITGGAEGALKLSNPSVRVRTAVKRFQDVIMLGGYATRWWRAGNADVVYWQSVIRGVTRFQWCVGLSLATAITNLGWGSVALPLTGEDRWILDHGHDVACWWGSARSQDDLVEFVVRETFKFREEIMRCDCFSRIAG